MDSKKKILIVDDSEMNRALLEDMLSNNFDIIEAGNGMEAAEILSKQAEDICLMLLDIVMPVMDGFETLALMNKNGWIKQIPVIMISAETVPTYVERAYDLGVLDYISRPFDERIVQRRVSSAIMLLAKQKELSRIVADQVYEKERNSRMMIEILSNIVEFHNGESGMHVLHIHTFTDLLLRKLMTKTDRYGLTQRDISLICNASALHDIGKIAVPSEILNKPGRLTKEEFEIMKTHSIEGARVLNDIPIKANEPLIKYGYQICRWHHERYDGSGYPDGLKGEQIPVAAQVVALADVYDALTSKRVYKDAFAHEQAIQMILDGQCGAFNPLLLECLKEVADALEREAKVNSQASYPEREAWDSVEQMLEMSKVDTTEKSVRALEHERMKNQILAEISEEIQFEYKAGTPGTLLLARWGANLLGVPEIIFNPIESKFGNEVFRQEDFADLLKSLEQVRPEQAVIEKKYLLNIGGVQRWHKVICKAIWEGAQAPQYTGVIGKVIDIQDDVEQVAKLQRKTELDLLTGLLNHSAAKQRIAPFLASGGDKKYALLMFDIDNFKKANDTYGHLFGDEVLRLVADAIRSSIRSTDIAARMGGDEFIIFIEYKGDVRPLVQRIFWQLGGRHGNFPIQLSMGVACPETPPEHYEAFFQMADEAMYHIKAKGGNSYCFYEDIAEK